MKPKFLIRIAAGCLLFFALGHSLGHFTRKSIVNVKAQEVLKIMTDFKYNQFGQMRSYDENYTGMSLNLIVTLLMLTFVLWYLSDLAERNTKAVRQMLIPIVLCVFAYAITGFMYFFMVPAVTCLLASLLLSAAVIQLLRTEKN